MATMTSQVVAVEVAEGDEVTTGETLVVLEAMKMEHRLVAPWPGRVRRVACAVGEVVDGGCPLVELEPDE